MLVIFINPFNRTISYLRIPSNPTSKLLLQIVGGDRLHASWIAYETRVYWGERDEAPDEEDLCFRLPGSHRLYSRALILGCNGDGEFMDVPMLFNEAVRSVRWEGGRSRSVGEVSDAVRRVSP